MHGVKRKSIWSKWLRTWLLYCFESCNIFEQVCDNHSCGLIKFRTSVHLKYYPWEQSDTGIPWLHGGPLPKTLSFLTRKSNILYHLQSYCGVWFLITEGIHLIETLLLTLTQTKFMSPPPTNQTQSWIPNEVLKLSKSINGFTHKTN